ncbi:MAG TPA: hypothetical protein VFN05_17330 [Actinomycetes bacterium]|nr:hypothetical protein [Actinomycetes bacterium]
MAPYARFGYDERIVAERVGSTQAGWAPERMATSSRLDVGPGHRPA